MAIPDYQTIMLPFLRLLEDDQEHTINNISDVLADQFNLTQEERHQLLPSGQQEKFRNRVGWARTYLKKANLIESSKRGHFHITLRGSDILRQNPAKIDTTLLKQFPEFREFLSIRTNEPNSETETGRPEITPEEALENAYLALRNDLADDLINQLKACSSRRFEQIVIDVLVAMGYGGSREDAAKAIGKSGDEGIDGIIKEDPLGLEVIYIQAKKWEATVGRPEIQKFAGALQGQRARKGIFITTSEFSKDALEYANRIENKIILIDSQILVQFMIDRNVGVSLANTYQIKKLDIDYFTEG
jgi:restriction system protein